MPTKRSLKIVGAHPQEHESFDIVYFLGTSWEMERLFLFIVSLFETFAMATWYFWKSFIHSFALKAWR